ncbi:hypothetical protein [Pseudochelatococcus sp. G4_1912]|uniref:hypothetical protein n=1 Tax=Pseudochelatococcus sp. G4_1912 TaxID=3114288 RepID=UPI0039C6D3E8
MRAITLKHDDDFSFIHVAILQHCYHMGQIIVGRVIEAVSPLSAEVVDGVIIRCVLVEARALQASGIAVGVD